MLNLRFKVALLKMKKENRGEEKIRTRPFKVGLLFEKYV